MSCRFAAASLTARRTSSQAQSMSRAATSSARPAAVSATVRRSPSNRRTRSCRSRAADARLTEVLIHHVDLDAGFNPGDWPADFTSRMLADVTASFARRDDAPALRLHTTDTGEDHGTGDHLVTGPATSLLAWLLGRSTATGLAGATHLKVPFLY